MPTIYVDSDNGDDTTGDGSFSTPWKTMNKAAETGRSAGDLIILRRGMAATYDDGGTFDPTNAGTQKLPIVVEADYGDAWSDDANSAQTYTTVFGAKTMTASATITGIVAGDWVYVTGDDQRVDCWEVADVTGSTLTLFLPFKGTIGAGLTLVVMASSPVYGTTSTTLLMRPDEDFWVIRGLHANSNNNTYVISTSKGLILEHCVAECAAAADTGFGMFGAPIHLYLFRCRAFNYGDGGVEVVGGTLYARECLFDGNSIANSTGLHVFGSGCRVLMEECEFKNNAGADIGAVSSEATIHATFRNCVFSSATLVETQLNAYENTFLFEDYDGEPGDTRQIIQQLGSISPIIQSETTKVRGGGGDVSIKVTPTDDLGPYSFNELEILNIPIELPASAKTVTVYFASDTITEWTAGPTAAELTVELSYWGHASNNYRRLEVTTATVDFTTDTDFDQTLAVTVTPAQAGLAYLRVIYRKPQESGKTNIFYVDTEVDVA